MPKRSCNIHTATIDICMQEDETRNLELDYIIFKIGNKNLHITRRVAQKLHWCHEYEGRWQLKAITGEEKNGHQNNSTWWIIYGYPKYHILFQRSSELSTEKSTKLQPNLISS